MNVNADFSQRVLMHGDEIPWEDSPMAGVERRRLDRVQSDNEYVTTIVRYAPNSSFSSHVHSGGEEFVVIDGTFEDDYGDWTVGSYVRNPPQSSHTPGSKQGCTILVKLGQFDPEDRQFIHANKDKLGRVRDADQSGVSVSPLYADAREQVSFEHWDAGARVTFVAEQGAELFVLEGGFSEAGDQLRQHSWLRIPAGYSLDAVAGEKGAFLWIKRNHLKGL